MIEVFIIVFLACGQPAFVSVRFAGVGQVIYAPSSVGKRWPQFWLDINALKGDPTVSWHEFKVEEEVEGMTCGTST